MSPVKRVVLACGVFDLFHVGHLRYLEYARSRGDYLIVGVSADDISIRVKGKSPVVEQSQRVELIKALACVDDARVYEVSLEQSELAADWILGWGVNHVVVGGDWLDSDRWQRLIPLLANKGISVEFAPRTLGVSTSDIIHRIRNSE